jgi:hypothetical protein
MQLTLVDSAPSRTLRRALRIVGAKEQLASKLNISLGDLEAYVAGHKVLPTPVYIAALDIVAKPDPGERRRIRE